MRRLLPCLVLLAAPSCGPARTSEGGETPPPLRVTVAATDTTFVPGTRVQLALTLVDTSPDTLDLGEGCFGLDYRVRDPEGARVAPATDTRWGCAEPRRWLVAPGNTLRNTYYWGGYGRPPGIVPASMEVALSPGRHHVVVGVRASTAAMDRLQHESIALEIRILPVSRAP